MHKLISNYSEENKKIAIIDLLIQHGADINAKDDKDNTPLHYAKTAEVAEILKKHGAK